MKVTNTRPVLEFHIGELVEFVDEPKYSWRIGDVAKDMAGGSAHIGYRIPCADTGTDITFNNLETLRRFAMSSLEHQRTFLRSIRAAMKMKSVDVAKLEVGWSRNRTRQLTIRLFGNGSMAINI